MVKKTVEIEVKSSGIQQTTNELNALDRSLDNVDSSADQVSTSINDIGENGGAIAILDEFTNGLATRLKDAFEASKLFAGSLRGIRTALVATGIGAFAVVLGTVVAYWEEIKGLVTGVNNELKQQLQIQNEIVRQSERELKNLENSENILRLQGKSEDQILQAKKQRLMLVIEEQKEALRLAQIQLQNQVQAERRARKTFAFVTQTGTEIFQFIGRQIDALLGSLGIDIGAEAKVTEIRGKVYDSLFGDKEGIEERKKEIDDLTDAIIANQNRIAGITLEQRDRETPQVSTVNEGIEAEGLKTLEIQKDLLDKEVKQREEAVNRAIRIEEAAAAQRINLEEMVNQARISSTQQAIGAISNLLERSSAAYKALAVTNAIIDAYQAISGVFANAAKNPSTILFPAYPYIQAAIAGVNAFATVKSILSVRPGSTSVPSAPSSTGPGNVNQPTSPEFNVIGQGGINQLASALQGQDQPIRAYVVSGEVETNAALDRNREREASFG